MEQPRSEIQLDYAEVCRHCGEPYCGTDHFAELGIVVDHVEGSLFAAGATVYWSAVRNHEPCEETGTATLRTTRP